MGLLSLAMLAWPTITVAAEDDGGSEGAGDEGDAPERVAEEATPSSRADVMLVAAETLAELEQLRERVERVGDLEAVREDVARQAATVEQLAPLSEALAQSAQYIEQTDDIEYTWARQAHVLTPSRDLVDGQAAEYHSIHARVDELVGLWDRTAAAFGAEADDSELAEHIETTRAAVLAFQDLVAERELGVLRARSGIATIDATIERVLERVRRASPSIFTAWRHRDRRPLWAGRDGSADVTRAARGGWRRRIELVQEFVTLSGAAAAVHVVLLVLFGWYLRRVGRSSGSAIAARALRRPWSASVLLWTVASPLLYPAIPSPVVYLLGVLTAAALLRVLDLFLTEPERGLAQLLLAIYAVDVVRYAGLVAEPVENWALVVEILAATLVAVLALRRATKGARIARGVAVIALAFLGPALVLDAAGYRAMAAILALGLLRILWAGLAILLASRLVIDAFDGALRIAPLNLLRVAGTHGEVVRRWVGRFVVLGAVAAWGWLALQSLTLRSAAATWAGEAAIAPHRLGSLEFSYANLGQLVAGVVVAALVATVVRFAVRDEVLPRSGLAVGVQHAVATTAFYAALMLGLVVTLTAAGVKPAQFAFMAGALGLGIGFGLQNIVNNFVSGLILLFGRPVEVGDFIEVGDLYGEVRRIGFRSSTVHTLEGAEVIVPNAGLISNEVINWTHSDQRRRIDVVVGVAYGTDVRKVISLLERVAASQAEVLDDPPSQGLFVGFGDSSLDFELRAWTLNKGWIEARSALAVSVSEAIAEAGIEIPFPQRDLHLRSVDHAAVQTVLPLRGSQPPSGDG